MKTSKIKIAKQPKMVKVAKANQEKVVKVAKASQTGTPQATKCPNCEVFSNYTRKFIGKSHSSGTRHGRALDGKVVKNKDLESYT